MNAIWIAIASISVLGLVFGLILGYASRRFAVEDDPVVEKIDDGKRQIAETQASISQNEIDLNNAEAEIQAKEKEDKYLNQLFQEQAGVILGSLQALYRQK